MTTHVVEPIIESDSEKPFAKTMANMANLTQEDIQTIMSIMKNKTPFFDLKSRYETLTRITYYKNIGKMAILLTDKSCIDKDDLNLLEGIFSNELVKHVKFTDGYNMNCKVPNKKECFMIKIITVTEFLDKKFEHFIHKVTLDENSDNYKNSDDHNKMMQFYIRETFNYFNNRENKVHCDVYFPKNNTTNEKFELFLKFSDKMVKNDEEMDRLIIFLDGIKNSLTDISEETYEHQIKQLVDTIEQITKKRNKL